MFGLWPWLGLDLVLVFFFFFGFYAIFLCLCLLPPAPFVTFLWLPPRTELFHRRTLHVFDEFEIVTNVKVFHIHLGARDTHIVTTEFASNEICWHWATCTHWATSRRLSSFLAKIHSFTDGFAYCQKAQKIHKKNAVILSIMRRKVGGLVVRKWKQKFVRVHWVAVENLPDPSEIARVSGRGWRKRGVARGQGALRKRVPTVCSYNLLGILVKRMKLVPLWWGDPMCALNFRTLFLILSFDNR